MDNTIVNKNVSELDKPKLTSSELIVMLNKEHHVEFKLFSRLLLSLSTGSLALLIGFKIDVSTSNNSVVSLYLISVSILFLSSLMGVIVQYNIVRRPQKDIQRIRDLCNRTTQPTPAHIETTAKCFEKFCVNSQIILFLVSFLSLVVFVFLFNLK